MFYTFSGVGIGKFFFHTVDYCFCNIDSDLTVMLTAHILNYELVFITSFFFSDCYKAYFSLHV